MISFEQFINFGFSVSLLVNALLFIPQVLHLLKAKSAEGLSFITFFGFNIIQIFTIIHAYFVGDYILLAGFLLSFFTCGLVSILIIYYRSPKIPKTPHY